MVRSGKTATRKKPARKLLSDAEKKQRREQRAYTRRIRTTFTNAGFVSLPTANVHREFGDKVGELDHVYVYENIVLICEDTTANDPRDHLKNKKLLADEIVGHRDDFLDWIKKDFATELSSTGTYDNARYKLFFLYFSRSDIVLSPKDQALFSPVKVVRSATLAYLSKMAQNIRHSSRTDIFRYLKISSEDIGTASSGGETKKISTTIIYPNDNTGFSNGVRIVSFMMSAEMLLKNSYVLRKDNWEESIELYQRLIEKERIQGIRRYLASKRSTFINNVIVSLPPNVEFKDPTGKTVDIGGVSSFTPLQMLVPDEINTICVIDGQHRIYAHYEGTDALESQIRNLRSKFHLLVTGLIFPDSMSTLEQRKFESELFLDINSNARPVPPDVLLFIETLKDPFSDLGVARQVLARMNEQAPFENRFQLSAMDEGKIKIASIIKFALRYLVEITDEPDRPTLFAYWSDSTQRKLLLKDRIEKKSTERLDEYVEFVVSVLAQYFSALRKVRLDDWNSSDSKLLSTTALNGFVIALRRSLPTHGVLDFAGYEKLLSNLKTDFDRANFGFASSQYVKYSKEILKDVFGLDGST